MSEIREILTFSAPIPVDGRHRAEELRRQQATPAKGEQVYLNTLSVSFVNYYLLCMGFETDLNKSDSWNVIQQTLMDVADLFIKNLGLLECRPVLSDAQFVYVPPEVQSNRIGYVAVQISKSFREATLLGFVKQVQTDLFPINQLQPLDNLLGYLEELSQLQLAEIADELIYNQDLVRLKQWLENIFETGWQETETILGTQGINPAWSLRSEAGAFISRGKLIDLGKLREQAVVLVISLPPNNEQEMDIIVEVHPTNGQHYLPPNLHLIVLDSEGASVMEAQTRSSNKNIQLEFSCEVRERFSVKLVLGDISITENFAIC
ncbi:MULTISPECIES: DUF1822 family protein [unclassified Nostoc]|uniref:DUF1822 family protein n=1 Tax=unclassified Nostoc TaxID=2593658 RepID=UPI002AD58CC0|nr:DUF1822 family protein [Nostoc sp. DedQUE03]MDZ7971105.1 DUF1822 family protein [Nostoc sp. DedQUE03]MDZ8046739.1 DUF1822 family protein [Nostoc sp. DedQUE02]